MIYTCETTIVHRIEADSADDAREKARDLTRTSGHESAEIVVNLDDEPASLKTSWMI